MNQELMALEKNHTWELTELPPGKRAIGCKWVYKVKYLPTGQVERLKARLVAKGYKHTFSPVAKFSTVRTLLAIASAKTWHLHQLDVNNAFLHGHLDEDVYMTIPPGYSKGKSDQVCHLKRSLYGLKQASRQWNIELTNHLVMLGFVQSKQDYSLFVKVSGSQIAIALIYVDDMLLTGDDESTIASVKDSLHRAFTIKDLGYARYFLGMEISRFDTGLLLNQRKYVIDLLKDAGCVNTKIAKFPMQRNLHLSIDDGELLEDPESYRRLVGRLLYLTLTRPDISYTVQQLTQFLSSPRQPHLKAALFLLRYLKGSVNCSLFYPSNNQLSIRAYCDADWGSCPFTCRSLSGYCVFIGDSLVSWKTKKQKTVSKSSAESEYRCMSYTGSELVWLIGLLRDLHIPVTLPIPLCCDNKAAQHLAANPVFHEKTKHLRIDCHFVRDLVQEGTLSTIHVPSNLQIADVFTKPLGAEHHFFLSCKLGLVFHYTRPP